MKKRTEIIGLVAFLVFSATPFHLLRADPYLVSVKRVPPKGIDGSLVIVGGGKMPASITAEFLKLAGGEKAKVVVIPTAGDAADRAEAKTAIEKRWKDRKVASITVLHTRDRKTADTASFVAPLKTATAVWFGGGSQSRIAEAYLGTAVEKELQTLIKRGGVIGGTSAGAAIMSRVMIASGNPKAVIKTGLDLLPDSIIDQHFTQRKRKPRLVGAIAKHPERFGLGIDEGTAVIVRGRQMSVIGDGNATVLFAPTGHLKPREIVLKSGQRADLTALRRAAVAHALPAYPPKKPPIPAVANGSLVIVGGGGMPADICKKFIELAGGPEALIVYLPTAVPDAQARRAKKPSYFTRYGAKNIVVLPQSRLKDVESPEFLAVLKKAKGIWFGGGRQWRFIDAYAGTKAYPLLHDVLKRGGVVGGSSAGASIQGGYLARANPLGNLDIMADGYERGLNFLPGVAIDQHFAQRRRFRDMTQLVDRYPQLLGIGLDEATAIVVKGYSAEVLGRGRVHFYDRRKPLNGIKDHESFSAGATYDLKSRVGTPRPPVQAKKPNRAAA